MQLKLKAALTGVCFVLLLSSLSSCSNRSKEDGVISVSADDPEMVAAIAHARSILPDFWQAYSHPVRGETNFCLKVKITDNNLVEHFWLVDIQTNASGVFGTINNDPETVHNVKIGDRIKIPEENISDWLYMLDSKMVGNFTIRALFKKMSPAEVEQMKRILANP